MSDRRDASRYRFVPCRLAIEHASTRLTGAQVHQAESSLEERPMEFSYRRFFACVGLSSLLPAIAVGQESANLTGHVTGEGGVALTGAAVSITELGVGAISRDDGSYSIAIPAARVNRQAVT